MTTEGYISPCVSKCEIRVDVCIHCGRTRKEIQQWPLYSHERRMEIMKRLGYGKRCKKNS